MKTLLTAILAILLICGIVADANAQVSRAGVIFLLLPPGARASGMGDAFTSIADDATATYWNPAGLGRYPLSPTWFDFPNNSGHKIRQIAVLKNGLPDNNYRKYDTWAILDNQLARFDGEKWIFGDKYYPVAGENADDIARRFSGVENTDSLAVLKQKLASVNNVIGKAELVALINKIQENIPADYAYIEDVKYSLESLLNSWAELTIDKVKYQKLQTLVNESLQDGAFSALEFDKVTFSINNAIAIRLPEELDIPFNFVLPDTLTILASDGEELWLGTPYGLHKYNGKRWTSYTTEDSLISNDITAIAFGKMQSVWIGTADGLSRFAGRKLSSFTVDNGLPANRIEQIAIGKGNDIWVSTDKGLAKFDGSQFKSAQDHPVNVGEDLTRIAAKFVHLRPGPALDAVAKAIREYNALGDSTLQTGTSIKLPFSAAIKGNINAIYTDPEGILWVGTTEGLVGYDGDSWDYQGFKQFTGKQGDTAEKIAMGILGAKAGGDNISHLAGRITHFNSLDEQPIDAGDMIYVPSAPVASEIISLGGLDGGDVLAGTKYGPFTKSGDTWKRYMHADLDKAEVLSVIEKEGEVWLASKDKLVINAHSKREMSFMHSNWLPSLATDIYFEYLSYVQHYQGIGTLGGAITFLSYGEQQRTGEQGEDLGTFFSYEMALAVSYGAKINEKLALGLSAKYINSHLSDLGAGQEKGSGTASSFAVDGGMLWRTPVRRLTMGLTITNIGPDISYIDAAQADPLPRNLTLGLAYELFKNPYNRLTIVGEASKQLIDLTKFNRDSFTGKIGEKMEEVIAHIGAEYWYGTFLALRSGFVNDKAGHQRYYTLGAGLQYSNYRFDFSYIPSTSEEFNRLGNTMRFSMTARF